MTESERCNRMCSVLPDSGELLHLDDCPREPSLVSLHNSPGCATKIAGASVVPEALPRVQYLVFIGASQRAEIGKPAEPLFIIRDYSCDLSLLEHDLGDEDRVRIACTAPGEIAAVTAIPAEKRSLESAYGSSGFHDSKSNVQRPTLNVQLSIQKGIEH